MKIVKNDLFDYEDRFIFQYENTFKFSLDSILLSEYVKVKNKKDLILDMCTGLAPVPLILSTKYTNNIVGIEIQKEIYDLALKSVKFNKLEHQINIINDDVNKIKKHFNTKEFDIITCNPPFFKIDNNKVISVDKIKKISRHESLINLEQIFNIASNFLKDNGVFYLVHRPERLDEIIILGNKNNINVKEIINVSTNENYDIKTILIKCVKNSKSGVKIKNINVFNLKTYKKIFEEI